MSHGHLRSGKKLRISLAAIVLAAGALIVNPQSAYPIRGGNNVTDSSMDYVAQVQHSLGLFCTGTLISPQWVLTAAHCVGGEPNAGNFTITLGTHERTVAGQRFTGIEVYDYPGYRGAHNDVALLKLDHPAQNIQPMQLAFPSQHAYWDGQQGGPFTQYDDGVIAGWGTNGNGWPGFLQFKGVSIMPTVPDGDKWPMIPVSAGPCGGDSGGPLMVVIGGQLYQVGVLKGTDCNDSGGNYSDVGQGVLRNWVTSTMAAH